MRDANIFSSFSVFVLVQHKYHSGTGSLPSVCSAVDSGIGKGGRAVLLWEGAWSFGILRTTPLVLAQHAAVLTTRRYSRKDPQVGEKVRRRPYTSSPRPGLPERRCANPSSSRIWWHTAQPSLPNTTLSPLASAAGLERRSLSADS